MDILRHTPVPTILLHDESLLVCQVSESYVAVSGAFSRPEQLLGRHIEQVLDKTTLPSLPIVQQCLQSILANPFPLQLEQSYHATIWRLRVIPISCSNNIHYIQMELENVTEARQRQLELQERVCVNDTFRILVETVKDYAIFMLDPQGNVATWNAGAEALKGYKREEIVGKHFSTFYSKEDREHGKPDWELEVALRDGRVEDEGWRYRSDGSRFWANVIITPVLRRDTLLGYSKVTRDMTEQRKARAELIAAYEEASKLKSEFLANMSHEIRTPMHGMLSALTLLLDTKLDPDQLELARVIQESGDVLLQVINDILDYSKLASGSFSISQDIISVPDIIQSIFRAQTRTSSSDVRLEMHLDPQLPTSAEGDCLRYRQIIQNLMSNAVKFTDKGYVKINARLEKEDEDSYTILTEVVDTGIGVPVGGSGALFTPFTQFDNSATKRFKGTGLGLSICKSLSELMGGTIGFRPNPEGRGSIFWFTAQLKRIKQMTGLQDTDSNSSNQKGDNNNNTTNFTAELKPTLTNPTTKTLLLAEDNPINQRVMLKMLRGLGFPRVDLAPDGRTAVDMVTHSQTKSYDLILMDINMPVLDGVAATKELRSRGVKTPIVAMTANALKGQRETYLAKGCSAFVAKPVDRGVLVAVLGRFLG